MRRIFNVAIFALLTYLIAGRAVVHMGGEAGSSMCSAAAAFVKSDARIKGFSEMAAGSQAEAAESRCLVTGQAPVPSDRLPVYASRN
jgi:hypothetical protein